MKNLFALVLIISPFLLQAQLSGDMKIAEKKTSSSSSSNSSIARTSGSIGPNEVILIPVVVHVVSWTGDPATDISDARICSQIATFNEDFTRTNADQFNAPTVFQNKAGNPRMMFYLASYDINGNPTSGITRHSTTTQFFDVTNTQPIKAIAPGWNSNYYLNIWIVSFAGNPNSATSPLGLGDDPDGLYVSYSRFGKDGVNIYGKIPIHEMGHWLGLKHTWGDVKDIDCSEDDGIADTPKQYSEIYGVSGVVTDRCNTTYPGVMYCNYMNYNVETMMNMFTYEQVTKMRAAFNPGGSRASRAFAYGYPIVGSDPACLGSSTFSIPNLLPSTRIVSWTSSNPSGLTINSAGQATRVNNFNGEVTITAQLGGCNGPKLTKVVDVGTGPIRGTYGSGGATYPVLNNSGSVGFSGSGSAYFNLKNINDPSATYAWRVVSQSGSTSYGFNGANANLSASSGGRITVECKVTTPCGVITGSFSCTSYSSSPFRVSAHPNPATDNVTIEAEDKGEFECEMIGQLGNVVRRGRSSDGQLNFDLNQLPAGIYFLRAKKESGITYERIFVK